MATRIVQEDFVLTEVEHNRGAAAISDRQGEIFVQLSEQLPIPKYHRYQRPIVSQPSF
jgi:hypothetical protein